ncbi:MAG: hypothetical protein M1530_00325, partial [Candidatus Marsarchaeota archaeon]|nr:hypothetical protein [Candidatus Marsarchaeota archaeon]
HAIKDIFMGKTPFNMAMALVSKNEFGEFSSPKTDFKIFVVLAEKKGDERVPHFFVADVDGSNLTRIPNVGNQIIEPGDLGLSTQAEIHLGGQGGGLDHRVARLTVQHNKVFLGTSETIEVKNEFLNKSHHFDVSVISSRLGWQ